jgi:type VI secretion system protein ImpG
LPGDRVQPVGFAEEEALIPYPLNTFRGYRYLQEYFAFQDKFLFVDVNGLDMLKALPEDTLKQVRGLELRFDIRKSGIMRMRPTLDNVKLYCTPIANLFKHDALPIRLDGKQDEYLLLPAESTWKTAACSRWKASPAGSPAASVIRVRAVRIVRARPSFDVPNSRPHYSIRQRSSCCMTASTPT